MIPKILETLTTLYECYGIEITKREPSFQENLLKMFQTTSGYGVLFKCDYL